MKCPKCKTNISNKTVAKYFASKGGQTTGATKARDPEKMRQAALKRWVKTKARNGKGKK